MTLFWYVISFILVEGNQTLQRSLPAFCLKIYAAGLSEVLFSSLTSYTVSVHNYYCGMWRSLTSLVDFDVSKDSGAFVFGIRRFNYSSVSRFRRQTYTRKLCSTKEQLECRRNLDMAEKRICRGHVFHNMSQSSQNCYSLIQLRVELRQKSYLAKRS